MKLKLFFKGICSSGDWNFKTRLDIWLLKWFYKSGKDILKRRIKRVKSLVVQEMNLILVLSYQFVLG